MSLADLRGRAAPVREALSREFGRLRRSGSKCPPDDADPCGWAALPAASDVRSGREAQPPQNVIDAEALQRRLATALVERGDVRSDAWQQAVERVPRHVLVPC